jgi:PAS domain S-box-containing protein
MILASAVAAPLTALTGWLVVGGLPEMSLGYHIWWRTMANFLGMIVYAPAVMALIGPNRRIGLGRAVVAVGAAVAVMVLFSVAGDVQAPTLYLAFPISMLAAAFVGGRMNHVMLAALISALALMTDRGIGPYAGPGLGEIVQFQLFAGTLLLSGTLMARVHRRAAISGERTRQILGAARDGVFVLEDDGLIAFANRAATATFGSDLVGRTIDDFWGPETLATIAAEGGASEIVHAGRPYDVTLDSYESEEGLSTVVVMRDLSDRHALERERRSLLQVVESSPDFIGFASPGGQILYLSPGARRMVGFDEAVDVRRSIGSFAPEWAGARLRDVAVPHAVEHGIWRGELAYLGPDGQELPVAQIVMAHRNERGEVEMLSTIAHDVRERVEAETRRQDLIDNTVHDLRNTLVAIGGATDMLRADTESGRPLERELVEILSGGVGQLEKLIDDLNTTRTLDHPPPLVREVVDLLALANQVVSLHVIGASRSAVSIMVHGRSVDVRGDRTQLHRLIENLVSNAIKFSPGGGTVGVTVDRTATAAVLTVKDEGIGIDAVDLDSVFAPRHRSQAVRQAGIAGSGLGLAICKQIADAHGGTIDVLSRPGIGSTFQVELPLTDGSEADGAGWRVGASAGQN